MRNVDFCLHISYEKRRNSLAVIEVLTTMVMESFIFWDITPFSPV
jgi:hypothetical protein